MSKTILAIVAVGLLWVGLQSGLAQTDGGSNVEIFFIACSDQAVINLSGQMQAGYDVYYQVFSGSSGTGTPLTSLRRVQVDGAYTFSEQIPYTGGATVAAGGIASVRVTLARETDASRTIFDTTVDDLQDGCNVPQFTLGTSLNLDNPTPTPVGPAIQSPFGGVLNPNIPVTEEPIVVIGPRDIPVPGRTANPGLVFAECDKFLPQADPGVIYDNDNVVVFWSWFARTPQQIQDHLEHAQYSVKLNGAPFVNVQTIGPERRGVNQFIFFLAHVGNLRPGHYEVEYKLTWDAPISDGYQDFGPGTDTPQEFSLCNFDVIRNPNNDPVAYNTMYTPTLGPVHDLP